MSAPIDASDFPAIRWRGHWIWVPEQPVAPRGFWSAGVNSAAPAAHGLFRRTFPLADVPARVPARVTADSRYALFVNSREVGSGPIRSQPRRLSYDLYDLAPYLQPGTNVVAIYVKYYGVANSYWMPAVPNNALGQTGILVFEADLGPAGWLVSDAGWKACLATAWDTGSPRPEDAGSDMPIEVFDARRFPHGWREVEFDDGAWGAVQVVAAMHVGGFARTQPPSDPYGPLYPRPIASLGGGVRMPASLRVETLAGPIPAAGSSPIRAVQAAQTLPVTASVASVHLPFTFAVPPGATGRLLLDMGRVVSGRVEFALQAPAGTILDLSYAEDPPGRTAGMDKMRAGTRYLARGVHDHFQVFDSNGFRYATLLVHGGCGAVTLEQFAVRELLYPWAAGAQFTCDDAALNRIFQAGLRTVELCSHDAFIDCPTREQRAWVGDGIVPQMVHLATNPDWRLAWHYLTLSNSPRADGILPMSVAGNVEASGVLTIPDWSLHWIHGVYNLYRFAGDRDAVAALLPTAARVLRWYLPYQTAAGVIKDVPEWNLVDWSSVSTSDTSSVLTALWARGLNEFAEMAAWLEETHSRRWAEALYARVRAGFEVFWDDGRGSYVDHIVAGARRPEMSQIAGALAIVSSLAPQERWPRIIATITDPERLVQRSWMGTGTGEQSMEKWQQQVREGRYEINWDVGREIVLAEPFMQYVVHDAVAAAGRADLLPDLYPRWSQFLAEGYDTLGECWDFGTHAHAWSCTPTRDMMFYTLGVTPAAPGYAKARIAPRLGRLGFAKGSIPTPHGLITVDASADRVWIESPVPVVVDLSGQSPRELPAGRHHLTPGQTGAGPAGARRADPPGADHLGQRRGGEGGQQGRCHQQGGGQPPVARAGD